MSVTSTMKDGLTRSSLLFAALLIMMLPLQAQTTYYVSTTGDDNNPGTFDLPFRTITKALTVTTVPGSTIFVRGGTYQHTATITISRSGTSTARFSLLAYPGERVLLDFSLMPIASGNRGIRLTGSYWYIKGFDIWKAGDNGMLINGSNNVIEFCSFFENSDSGLQLDNGASNNQIINCDAYWNMDPTQGNADGFAPKLSVGSGNSFFGCRSWQNSDDGYDGYLRGANNVSTVLENSWIFNNGYLKTGAPSTGNGNGIKMGGGDNGNADSLRHNLTMIRCLVFDNRVKGFDQNNNRGSMTIYHGSAFRNGTNYSVGGAVASGSTITIINSLALGAPGSIATFAVQQTNGWMPPFSVTTGDFLSIDTSGVRGPRNADGSLPRLNFMRLAQGSDLIDGGTNVGLPYLGSAPDLGCFEYDGPTAVNDHSGSPTTFRLEQNFPNPFGEGSSSRHSATRIRFSLLGSPAPMLLRVYDVLGREVVTLVQGVKPAGTYEALWNAPPLASGMYFYTLESRGQRITRHMLLLK